MCWLESCSQCSFECGLWSRLVSTVVGSGRGVRTVGLGGRRTRYPVRTGRRSRMFRTRRWRRLQCGGAGLIVARISEVEHDLVGLLARNDANVGPEHGEGSRGGRQEADDEQLHLGVVFFGTVLCILSGRVGRLLVVVNTLGQHPRY